MSKSEYIQVWQCIGCGRIEAPQTCIGVCRDRKVMLIGSEEHERVLAERDLLRERMAQAHAMLLRFGLARPRAQRWEASWNALQAQVREVLVLLAAEAQVPQGRQPSVA